MCEHVSVSTCVNVCEHACVYVCTCVCSRVCVCSHPAGAAWPLVASPGTSLVLPHCGERGSWPRAWLCALPARALPTPVCSPSRSSPGQGENQVLLSSSVSPGVRWCRPDTGAASALVLFSLVTWLPPACLKRERESVPRVEAGS